MYEQTLSKAGLSTDQAKVYELLLRSGSLPAGQISKKSGLKRGLTYKVLDELTKLGLVEKKTAPGGVLAFSPAHPLRLQELAEDKEKEAKTAQTALAGVLANLTSDFNLISGKPGVLYYEGREAIKKITFDSLTAQGEIYSYIDNEAIDRYLLKENEEYVAERVRRGIIKKIICPDSAYARGLIPEFERTLAEVRVIPPAEPFHTITQIYDNKISYLTASEKVMIGILIEDPYISQMNRTLFEALWKSAVPITKTAGNIKPPFGGPQSPPDAVA